ncbi:MAG: ChbG/HpnK family deacetylase [Candidatus Chisholmbacteria bacterium]|nr:ChbG/HpnK family deacetylase [Candidatus Chisholmbacteria bacterium]
MLAKRIACIFPVHNEAAVLAKQLKKFVVDLKQAGLPVGEIILVENGSQDNSWRIIESLRRKDGRIQTIRLPHASYGEAVRVGLEHARGERIFVLNVDFFDVAFMQQALPLLEVTDIVIASKTLGASDDQRSFGRRWVTYFFNVLLRLMLNYPGTDTHGIKGFKKTRLLHYSLMRCRTHHELFDTELIIRMTRWGAKLVELPITVREIRPSRYSVIKRSVATAIDLVSALWSKLLIPGFPQRLVVADDYGISASVNQAILKVASRQLVDIVSVMPNMVSKSAVTQLQAIPKVSFSAHLNVVEGKPLSNIDDVSTLVNSRGEFYSSSQFFWRLLGGKIQVAQIERELGTQIQRLREHGLKIKHLDSHQHWHLQPPIGNVVVRLARRFKVRQIRSFDSTRNYLKSKPLRYVGFLVIHLLLRLRFGPNGFSTETVDEIIVHPGTDYDQMAIDSLPRHR